MIPRNEPRAPSALNPRERQDRRWILLLCAAVSAAIAWAALAPVDRIVRAEGRIVAAGRAQILQHLEGGIVTEIAVREGQSVAAGDVVMKLSSVQASKDVRQGESRLQALTATRARLQAEATGRDRIAFADDVGQEYRGVELAAFAERANRLRSEQSVLQEQISQRRAELAEAEVRGRNAATELELSRKQSAMVEALHRRGTASQLELIEAQGRTQRMISAYGEAVATIPRLNAAIGEMQSRLAESLSRFRADARVELSQISAEIDRISLAVGGDSDRLARTEVRAPVSGIINRLNFNTIGGVVKPGEAILEITPTEGPLAVEARVRPDDRAALRQGLPTRVMVGAYDYAVYGALDGKLVEVSSDTLPDERGGRYYRVTIEVARARGALAREPLLPGMTTRADIVLGQRSVLSYLLSPLLRFQAHALRESR